jgi:hypothetical protein
MGVKPEKWGPLFWGALHVAALGCSNRENLVHFVECYKAIIPCMTCRQHFEEVLSSNPVPAVSNPVELFAWTVEVHNLVNKRLGKPVISPEDAYDIWMAEPTSICTQKIDFKIIIFIIIAVALILFILLNKQ